MLPFSNLMRCVDPSDLAVQGGLSSQQAQRIQIDIERCNESTEVECKSNQEIE